MRYLSSPLSRISCDGAVIPGIYENLNIDNMTNSGVFCQYLSMRILQLIQRVWNAIYFC